ncbi:MAG: helix-hairpin-helix domain-containing protein [Phaeodactylibacter sp.]|nr:helix-hairpin-helix domain-containing protein [Phaeodactylibacter sp.]
MKALLPYLALLLPCLAAAQPTLPDSLRRIVILQPTGETIGGLPEMAAVPDTARLHKVAMQAIDNTFAREIIELYFLAQVYLRNQGERETIEPAYLALTQNQGGYARFGFHLQGAGPMPHTPYVDIIDKTIEAPMGRLMSFTQLYPHEMGHVIYRLLSSDSSREETSRCVDMHYFSVMTDYGTAFNEGYAEHIENAARRYEPNDSIRAAIMADIRKVQEKQPRWKRGFERDFCWPLRMGYYKATMVLWYQQLEDLKRYEQAINGMVRFKNASLQKGSAEDRLTFRNSGLYPTSEPRNRPQALATEGAVSLFFTRLFDSPLPATYREPAFYRQFLYDTTRQAGNPRELFTPWQNLYLKHFAVLHNFVTFEHSSSAQALDFLEGYCQTFPDEKEAVEQVFQASFGESHRYLPPEIWLLVKGHEHRLLALDAFGAITVPVYTFDINRAELEDLLTLPGLSEADAKRILKHRWKNGFFHSLEAAAAAEGLSPEGREALLAGAFDEAYFESLPEPELNIAALLTTPLKRLLLHALPWLALAWLLAFTLFRGEGRLSGKAVAGRALGYGLLWLLFVTAGLGALVVSSRPLAWFLPSLTVALVLAALIYRKKPVRLKRSLVVIGTIGIFITYNLL